MKKKSIITILLALVAMAGRAQDVTNKADSGWLDTVSYDAADSVTVSLQLASKTAGETCSIRRISTMSKINLVPSFQGYLINILTRPNLTGH